MPTDWYTYTDPCARLPRSEVGTPRPSTGPTRRRERRTRDQSTAVTPPTTGNPPTRICAQYTVSRLGWIPAHDRCIKIFLSNLHRRPVTTSERNPHDSTTRPSARQTILTTRPLCPVVDATHVLDVTLSRRSIRRPSDSRTTTVSAPSYLPPEKLP